jgi:hypothetical protein
MAMENNVIIRQHLYGVDTDVEYSFTIYGEIPELGPVVSFRRTKARREIISGEPERKEIKCPYCTNRLTDVRFDVKVEMKKRIKAQPLFAEMFMKCDVCKNESGLNLKNVA